MRNLLAMLLIAILSLMVSALGESPNVPGEIVDLFSDTWVAEGFSAEIGFEEGAFTCDMALNDDSFCEYGNCRYDAASETLVCTDGIRFYATYDEATTDYIREEIASGLTAVFTVENGALTCEDSEGLLRDIDFLRLSEAEMIDAVAEFDASLIGEWQTADGMAVMTVEKNPSKISWDVEIVGAKTSGAYVFKATIRCDEAQNRFTYNKGKYWDVPITDSDEKAELGEAKIAGASGAFTLADDDACLCLIWVDDRDPEGEMAFRRQADDTAAD